MHHSKSACLISALGQKRTLRLVRVMSVLPLKGDIRIATDYARRSGSGIFAIFCHNPPRQSTLSAAPRAVTADNVKVNHRSAVPMNGD